jgi:predicted nucleotidyltransferase
VFGSIARGDDHPDSDIDILVEFEPGADGTIYG